MIKEVLPSLQSTSSLLWESLTSFVTVEWETHNPGPFHSKFLWQAVFTELRFALLSGVANRTTALLLFSVSCRSSTIPMVCFKMFLS